MPLSTNRLAKPRILSAFLPSIYLGLIIALVAPTAMAVSGTRIDVDFIEARTGHVKQQARVWIAGRRLRIDHRTPGRKGSEHVLLYRGDLDLFYSVDPGKKLYTAIDRMLIAAVGFQKATARREVDAQLQKLPDDQHRMLERLFGVREPGEALERAPVRVVARPDTQVIGHLRCRRMDILREMAVIGEVCVVPWSKIGIGIDDLEIFRQFANFQRELMGAKDLTPLEIVPNQELDVLVQFDGFPLYLRRGEKREQQSVIRVTGAKAVQMKDRLFEVPAGYRERSVLSLLAGEDESTSSAPAKPAQ
jgi:hypothetical protein